jgi:hypothetical protein
MSRRDRHIRRAKRAVLISGIAAYGVPLVASIALAVEISQPARELATAMTSSQQFIIALAGPVVTLAVALLGFVKLNGIHQQMNSRLDELLKVKTEASHAVGVKEGEANAASRAAAVAEGTLAGRADRSEKPSA